MDAGLMPVKRLTEAKGRLAEHFDAPERAAIADALFEDALHLCTSATFLEWWIVSPDEDVRARAEAAGVHAVADPPGADLNAALARALEEIGNADSVTIVPGDVPLARAEDLQDVIDTGATSDVVVVPSIRDGGTNALYLSPPDLLPPRFGPASLSMYVEAADRKGLRCSLLDLSRLALDVDTLRDVDDVLAQHDTSGRTVEVLRELRRTVRGD